MIAGGGYRFLKIFGRKKSYGGFLKKGRSNTGLKSTRRQKSRYSICNSNVTQPFEKRIKQKIKNSRTNYSPGQKCSHKHKRFWLYGPAKIITDGAKYKEPSSSNLFNPVVVGDISLTN